MAFVTEVYNTTSKTRAIVSFKENLASAFVQEEVDADLIIGTFINTPVVLSNLASMSGFREALPVDPFPSLAESSLYGDSPRLVPLSFELPMILINPGASLRLRDPFISMDEIETNSRKYRRFSEERPTRLGFVPGLNPLARYYLLRLRGVEFSASAESEVRWDQTALTQEAMNLAAWSDSLAVSEAEQQDFIGRFLYDPIARQFERGRIAFAFSPSSRQLDWRNTIEADFRWLASATNRVPILDTVVWAAIPSSSGNKNRAESFLVWYLTYETQEDLILKKIEQRISRFGFFGGFSSLDEVNRTVVPRVYPELRGRIIPESMLDIPPQLPRYWDEAVAAVLLPHIGDRTIAPSDLSSQLRSAMNTWYLQRGD